MQNQQKTTTQRIEENSEPTQEERKISFFIFIGFVILLNLTIGVVWSMMMVAMDRPIWIGVMQGLVTGPLGFYWFLVCMCFGKHNPEAKPFWWGERDTFLAVLFGSACWISVGLMFHFSLVVAALGEAYVAIGTPMLLHSLLRQPTHEERRDQEMRMQGQPPKEPRPKVKRRSSIARSKNTLFAPRLPYHTTWTSPIPFGLFCAFFFINGLMAQYEVAGADAVSWVGYPLALFSAFSLTLIFLALSVVLKKLRREDLKHRELAELMRQFPQMSKLVIIVDLVLAITFVMR